MEFDTIITALVAIVSLFLGILVLRSDYKNAANKLFFSFNLCASIWVFSSLAAKYSNINTVRPYIGIGFAAASLLVYFFLMFCITFPNGVKTFSRWWHILLILPLIFLVLSFFNMVAVAVSNGGSTFKVSPGLFYIPYSLFLLSYIIASIVKLVFNYRNVKGITKGQLYYILLGSASYAFLALFFSLVMPLVTQSENIYRWGIYSVIIFLIFTAYAIVERGFLNIKVIFTEAAITVIIIALLIMVLMSENFDKGLINGAILLVVAYGSYLVISSMKKEIAHNKQLRILTTHLEQDKHDLMDLDRMKDEFLQMATHELNTPITVIQGKLSMAIEEDMCHLDEEQKGFLKPVLNDTTRLSNLSKDILNTARIDQNRLKINAIETDLDNLISQIASGFEITAKERGNSVAYVPVTRPLPKITLDQSKISEVLQNLLSNANKFTENGKILVSAKVQDKYVVVSVSDTGMGINAEDQKHLFQKFYQAGRFDPDNPQEQQGSGLGLYISRSIVELHGGKMWLESTDGKGATFYFSLPLEYHEVVMPSKLHIDEAKLRVL